MTPRLLSSRSPIERDMQSRWFTRDLPTNQLLTSANTPNLFNFHQQEDKYRYIISAVFFPGPPTLIDQYRYDSRSYPEHEEPSKFLNILTVLSTVLILKYMTSHLSNSSMKIRVEKLFLRKLNVLAQNVKDPNQAHNLLDLAESFGSYCFKLKTSHSFIS